jgi:hypothetical protein
MIRQALQQTAAAMLVVRSWQFLSAAVAPELCRSAPTESRGLRWWIY